MSEGKPGLVFLMGPTASGKTDLAMALFDYCACEIISVDSALVYRGLDIGAAKPTAEEQQHYPHHLIDIRDPVEPYSVAEFRTDALAVIEAVHRRGNLPVLVGGTMLYFKALLDDLADMPASDPEVRAAIEAEAAERGWPAMHAELARVDPASAARIHPNHSQRLSRALEVYRISGQALSTLHARQQDSTQGSLRDRYRLLQIAVAPSQRQVLHRRIERRFLAMLDRGFEEEVRGLRARGDLNVDLPAIRAVGYRQMWQYLNGEFDRDTMIEKGIVATRQLAKRQLTWLRGWSDLHWLEYEPEAAGADGDVIKRQLLADTVKMLENAGMLVKKCYK